MLAAVNPDTLLGVAAILTAIGGGAASIYSIVASKKEASKQAKDATAKAQAECHERLIKVQRESEAISEELHQLKMGRYTDEG